MKLTVDPVPGLLSNPVHLYTRKIKAGSYLVFDADTREPVGRVWRAGKHWRSKLRTTHGWQTDSWRYKTMSHAAAGLII